MKQVIGGREYLGFWSLERSGRRIKDLVTRDRFPTPHENILNLNFKKTEATRFGFVYFYYTINLMKLLNNTEKDKIFKYIEKSVEIAKKSTCERSKCGSVIVKDDEIIGFGFNSPPFSLEEQKRCSNFKDLYNKKVTDKTCCIHAEQRAIIDALKRNSEKIKGSTLYFVRLDKSNKASFSGNPYCTICSKMSLDVGISKFVLYKEDGMYVFNTQEYNDLSYRYIS